MEDLDRVTSSVEHERRQLADLAALGIAHDGDVVRQSERFSLYDAGLRRLEERGLVYPCWCTRREILQAAQAPHERHGVYPGTCRHLDDAGRRERARRARELVGDRAPALRLDAAAARKVLGDETDLVVHDLVLGDVEAPVDDVVLRRNDGVPAYHLAVVVDDALQDVDQVVRGDDLAPVTSTQILLARLLEYPIPRYAHVPLVVGPDGERLAKRHGAVTLSDLRSRGRTPTEILSAMLRTLGLEPVASLSDLADRVEDFDWTVVARVLRPWVADDL